MLNTGISRFLQLSDETTQNLMTKTSKEADISYDVSFAVNFEMFLLYMFIHTSVQINLNGATQLPHD